MEGNFSTTLLEPAVHIQAVIGVADIAVEAGKKIALGGENFSHSDTTSRQCYFCSVTSQISLMTPVEGRGVNGASQRASVSASAFSNVIEKPDISSEVHPGTDQTAGKSDSGVIAQCFQAVINAVEFGKRGCTAVVDQRNHLISLLQRLFGLGNFLPVAFYRVLLA